jgi:hypothetical protein
MSYYGTTDYSHNSDFALRVRDMRKGNLDFEWLDQTRERVGLEVSDCEVGPYAIESTPEIIRENRGLAPRGAILPTDYQPDLGPSLNKRTDVWAYKVQRYWEEAMSRQWNVTTDVPWRDLDRYEIPDDQEIAFCQLCTLLSEVEMIATDLPAKWSHHMNSYFQEVPVHGRGPSQRGVPEAGPGQRGGAPSRERPRRARTQGDSRGGQLQRGERLPPRPR